MVGGKQGDIDFVSEELIENDILWVQQKKTGKLLECCDFSYNYCSSN